MASPNQLATATVPNTGYLAEGVIPAVASTPTMPNPAPAASVTTPPTTPANDAFEQAWTAAQTGIDGGQYSDALRLMTSFYRDANLSPEQRERMITLLDQTAGTVIYSAGYHLQSAHAVQPGESLATIAASYSLSPEFLSRVNALPMNSPLAPGTQLKVVQGPFRVELSLSGRELTLFLGQYYAGRFSCAVGRDLPAQANSFEVVGVAGARPYVDYRTGEQIPPGDPRNPYGDHWIELATSALPGTVGLAIHSYGSAVESSDTRGCISVSPGEANDLALILSTGSQLTVVR